MAKRRDEITDRVEALETRIAEIDARFGDPAFYEGTAPEAVRELQTERSGLRAEAETLLEEWERVEEWLATLE